MSRCRQLRCKTRAGQGARVDVGSVRRKAGDLEVDVGAHTRRCQGWIGNLLCDCEVMPGSREAWIHSCELTLESRNEGRTVRWRKRTRSRRGWSVNRGRKAQDRATAGVAGVCARAMSNWTLLFASETDRRAGRGVCWVRVDGDAGGQWASVSGVSLLAA